MPLGLTDRDISLFRGTVTKANRAQLKAMHKYISDELIRRDS